MNREIREQLKTMAEPDYARFTAKLSPQQLTKVLGVRQPTLRKFAKELQTGDWRGMMEEPDEYMEETMLRGMLIAAAKLPPQEHFELMAEFVPRIDGWAVCDCFCADLKMTKKHLPEMWDFLEQWLDSGEEFQIRFGVVMLLDYYLQPEWIDAVLARLNQVDHPAYYVKMAVAWAISIAYVKFPAKTEAWILTARLDKFTYQKALQKTIESLRIDAPTKDHLRTMKKMRFAE